MGGKEINEIIIHLRPMLKKDDLLVLSPHRNILELRKYLHHSDYHLKTEICLKDEGQFYQILCLSLDPELPKVALFGDKIWQGTTGAEYRQSQLKHFSLHQDHESREYVKKLSEDIN